MAEPKPKQDDLADFKASAGERRDAVSLQRRAVAVDPPPAGAVGIQELLSRFEDFAEAGELVDPPETGAVGIRELLARLAHLAEAGYFASPDPLDSENE